MKNIIDQVKEEHRLRHDIPDGDLLSKPQRRPKRVARTSMISEAARKKFLERNPSYLAIEIADNTATLNIESPQNSNI